MRCACCDLFGQKMHHPSRRRGAPGGGKVFFSFFFSSFFMFYVYVSPFRKPFTYRLLVGKSSPFSLLFFTSLLYSFFCWVILFRYLGFWVSPSLSIDVPSFPIPTRIITNPTPTRPPPYPLLRRSHLSPLFAQDYIYPIETVWRGEGGSWVDLLV